METINKYIGKFEYSKGDIVYEEVEASNKEEAEYLLKKKSGWLPSRYTLEIYRKELDAKRCTGRTTRLVDDYIQKLFNEGYIEPKDHHDSKDADRYLCDKIRRRLKFEHPNVRDKLRVNKEFAIGIITKQQWLANK